MRPEHEYAGKTRTQWERVVFDNADEFVVYNAKTRQRVEFKDFPAAVEFARTTDRTLLYAVTKSGRSTCIDRADWDQCLAVWLERHPTT
jgi:hypothetical protein